jgi:putative phosphoribosyl transferase
MRRRIVLQDRGEAGRLLAEQLAAKELNNPVILGLPRGGLPVAAAIAQRLNAPLDVALVRKLGAPGQPELAIGAIADGGEPVIVLNGKLVGALGLDENFVTAAAQRELAVIEERRREYAAIRQPIDLTGRAVIVVDDGVATGMHLVSATPIASRDAAKILRGEADDFVCLSAPRYFRSVGSFYRQFPQVTDEDVEQLLSHKPTIFAAART